MFNTSTRPAVSASFRRVQVLISAVRPVQSPVIPAMLACRSSVNTVNTLKNLHVWSWNDPTTSDSNAASHPVAQYSRPAAALTDTEIMNKNKSNNFLFMYFCAVMKSVAAALTAPRLGPEHKYHVGEMSAGHQQGD